MELRSIVPFAACLATTLALACNDDAGTDGGGSNGDTETETSADSSMTETSDSVGDGDGDPGDGDGAPGDGDGAPGDGDGAPGDGDGAPGDGDGDGAPGDGDGDGDGDPFDVCGDGLATGPEVCDDGINDGSYGGCNPDCLSLAPYCGDGVVNGPEACDDANAEIDDGCFASCEIPASCADILAYDDMAGDGLYQISPDPMQEPYPAYCDMTTDGGGWTLAMRFAPVDGQFHFYSSHWTQSSVVNDGVQDPTDPSDGKFWAYEHVTAGELRGCLQNPMDQSYGCKAYALPEPTTLLDLFTTVPVGSDVQMEGLYFDEDDAAKLEWLTIQGRTVNQASITPNYIAVGVNIDDDLSCYDAKVRFGLVLNNEANISTLNDAAGFGAQSYYTAACDLEGQDSNWKTACGFAAGPTIYSTAGQIWVR